MPPIAGRSQSERLGMDARRSEGDDRGQIGEGTSFKGVTDGHETRFEAVAQTISSTAVTCHLSPTGSVMPHQKGPDACHKASPRLCPSEMRSKPFMGN